MPIRPLPPLLVNQIAAGEVIERPASVVKELVENAIDAGANRVEIAIEQGGCELVRVSDNGCGIPFDEVPLAIAPHATSKIVSAADLDAIATLGFRGEALASIASVSRLSILSRPTSQPEAAWLTAEGEQVAAVRPAGGPVGTTVTVRNLFFNTPARRKFLRAEQTETTRVVDTVQNIALAHWAVAFSLQIDGKSRLDLPANQPQRSRVLDVLGHELAEELLEVASDEHVQIWGLIGKPAIARGTAKHQRLFVNGRLIVDRSINHAIKEAYRGLIEPTRHPTAVLFLRIDPAEVDVNVHPTKSEVRFRTQSAVHSAVLHALRRALRSADLTPELHVGSQVAWAGEFGSGLRPDESAAALGSSGVHAPSNGGAGVAGFVEYFRRLNPVQKGFVYSEVKQALAKDSPELLQAEANRGLAPSPDAAPADLPTLKPVAEVMQVHSSYIVTQDEQGLVIIDQHALHERVLFEKLKARIETANLESQRLLLPATVEVDQSHMSLLEELRPLLARIGIEAEPIGPAAVAVHSFTTLLFERGVDPATFVGELLDKAASRTGAATESEAALHETLDMMACKAAVKAGDALAPAELAELLKHRETVERSSNCPHGRPTTLRLSLKELERQFGRT